MNDEESWRPQDPFTVGSPVQEIADSLYRGIVEDTRRLRELELGDAMPAMVFEAE